MITAWRSQSSGKAWKFFFTAGQPAYIGGQAALTLQEINSQTSTSLHVAPTHGVDPERDVQVNRSADGTKHSASLHMCNEA